MRKNSTSPFMILTLVILLILVIGVIALSGAVAAGVFLPPKPTYFIITLEKSTLTITPTITSFPATLMTVQGPTMRIRTVGPTPEIPNTLIPLVTPKS